MRSFVRDHIDTAPIVDTVFTIVDKAKKAKMEVGEENVCDATIGSLYTEEGTLVAFESVFGPYNHIENTHKAKYAGSFRGNEDFRERVYTWVKQSVDLKLKHSVVATPGGSGAVSTTIVDVLNAGDTLVLPEIAWGSYKLMASMSNIKCRTYSLFEEDHFNLNHFEKVCREVMEEQGKLLAIINDPCHNPTGYSLTKEEWEKIIEILNTLSKQGPVVLLNDIAYIDFAYDFDASRNYLETFNAISDNVMIVVAFSCSKTLTSYGLRCGAAVILGQQETDVKIMEEVMVKTARATWSNIPNAAMENFVYVTSEGYDAFDKEKAYYVNLLKERSSIFVREAKECGLVHYPYKEGFFVTIAMEDNELLDRYHEALMKEHIYTVKVNKGIRVAVCSLSVAKCYGLAKRMKEILESIYR